MKERHHLILYSALSLALIVAVFVSVHYAMDANRTVQTLENTYTQRLAETQEHLQAIALKLDKTPVAADTRTQVELLTGVSRQADNAVSGLAALPLSHVAMSDTLRFCNQLAEYTMQLALRMAAGQVLSDDDVAQLKLLQDECTLLLGQFATAQAAMVTDSLRIANGQRVFFAEAQAKARPLEQVDDADNGMDYPTMIYDGAFSDARHYGQPKALGNAYVDEAQAVEIARAFVGAQRVRTAEPAQESGGTLPCFGVRLTLNDGTVLNADVTKQGGKLLWIVPEHAAFPSVLTPEECIQKAQAFLAQHDYGDMEPNHYQLYDGLAVINFVAVQDGVLLYPDLVKVQLRMDTGELVGLESNNYLMNHTHRTDLTPALTPQQALSSLSPLLQNVQTRLCLIPYRDAERLCYEAAGEYDSRAYRVYIDAQTGEELQVLLMLDDPSGRHSAGAGAVPLHPGLRAPGRAGRAAATGCRGVTAVAQRVPRLA